MNAVTEQMTCKELFASIRKLATECRCGIIISQNCLDIGDEIVMKIPNTFLWQPYFESGRRKKHVDLSVMKNLADRYGEPIQWVELVREGEESFAIPETSQIIIPDALGRKTTAYKEFCCSFVPERCLCLHATNRISMYQQDGLRVCFSKLSGYQGYDGEEREIEVSNLAQTAGFYINSLQSTGNTLFVPVDISFATSEEIATCVKGKKVHHAILENLLTTPKAAKYAGIWLFVTASLSEEQIQILEQYKRKYPDERITLVDI